MRTKIIFVGDLREFFSVRAWEFLDVVQPTPTAAATLNGIMFQVSENSCSGIKHCDFVRGILSHVRVNNSLLFQLFCKRGKSCQQ